MPPPPALERLRALLTPSPDAPRYEAARWLFLRLLGLCYFFAFFSLAGQVKGLIGADGLLPAADYLKAVEGALGPGRWAALPSLFWFKATDAALQGACYAGAGLAVLLVLDAAPALLPAALWALWLSVAGVGQDFLGFQWDALLLEAGLLAVFLAPLRLKPGPRGDAPAPRVSLFLLRWLLFRLMLESGLVKLLSGDPNWRGLKALLFHFETQPLPTWLGWFAHQAPAAAQEAATALTLFIELVPPFLALGPRWARRAAFFPLALLQVLIALTGNYCYFNLLTFALCLPLLDDGWLLPLLPGPLRRCFGEEKAPGLAERAAGPLRWAAALLILSLSLPQLTSMAFGWGRPAPLSRLEAWAAPLRSVNTYGLFAVMTVARPEIVIEGSDDNEHWTPYEFKWKPGALERRPRFVEPFQPRLDWQMWFAALGRFEPKGWFVNLLIRLLQGSPEVLALLDKDPFGGKPPRYVRANLYKYSFTDWKTLRAEGRWWKREPVGPYSPVASLGGK